MTTIILAARGGITTHFRQDIGRGFLHNGIDQGHGNGTELDLQIKAPADGVVTATGRQGSYGNRLIIRHDDDTTSLLAHHERQLVTVGQWVTQGQIIAVMGNTGTKFVHSHQEYRAADGTQLDPLLHLAGVSTGASTDRPTDITPTTPIGTPEMKLIQHKNTVTGDVLHYLVSDTEVLDLAGAGQDEIDTYAAVYGVAIPIHDHRFDFIKNAVAINKDRSQSAILAAIRD